MILDFSDISVSCNGINNIVVIDDRGLSSFRPLLRYCSTNRPTSLRIITDGSRWISMERYGTVSYNLNITFANSLPTVAPITTQAPITQAPPSNMPIIN